MSLTRKVFYSNIWHSLKAKIDNISSDNAAKFNAVSAKLNTEVKELRSAILSKDVQIEKIKEVAEAVKKENNELAARLQIKNDELDKEREVLAEKQKQLDEHLSKPNEVEAMSVKVKKMRDDCLEALRKQKTEMATSTSEQTKLRTELSSVTAEKDKLKTQIENNQRQHTMSLDNINKKYLEVLNKNNKEHVSVVDDLKSRIDENERKYQSAKQDFLNTLNDQNSKIHELTSELKKVKEENLANKDVKLLLEKKEQKNQENLHKYLSELNSQKAEIAKLSGELTKMKDEKTTLDKSLISSQLNNDNLTEKLE